jgi:cytochrome c553
VNPTGGAAQIEDDDFSNVDQTVPEGTSATLGTGILPITGWAAGDTLQISFQKFAAATAVDAGSGGGCKSVATFTADAVPAIKANSCLNCHNTGGSGNASLDLSALALATPNDTTACAQALSRINTTTPAQSDIILAPTGQVANHPFTSATTAYVTAMETWIAAEK